MRYAQINDSNICFATLETSGTIDAPHMIAIGENEPWPLGMVWDGTVWEAVEHPPPPPPQVSRIEFVRLFTGEETARYNQNVKAAANLTDYANPANAGLVMFEAFLLRFNTIEGKIDLGHADTINAVALFRMLGILQTQARADAILSGVAP